MSDTEQPKLSLADLASIASVIDACVQRGAFKANEVKQIGELYEKVVRFVNFIEQSNQKENSSENEDVVTGDSV